MAIEVEVARWQHGEREERLFWSDDEDGRLEDRLQEICVAIVLTGERQYRKARQFSYEWDRRNFDEKIERARKAREAAEQEEREKRLQAEQDAISRLLAQVSSHHQALQIRAYVAATTASPHAVPGRAFDGERKAWALWALTVADQLDPLAPGLPVGYGGRAGLPESHISEGRVQGAHDSVSTGSQCCPKNGTDGERTKMVSRSR